MRTPSQLEASDEIDRLLIQAGAIVALLRVEPSDQCVLADGVVQNAAWLLESMIERVHVLIQETDLLSGSEVNHG
jgi:hypothetical protein